ncbi:prepilin-type N-terminal cleavage/methylation domain-containing protein [Aeromonas caviae]|uniref:Prepilin-type N-terminal cleavage/methylation domain-containing protein n=1 Tax=Aeromonas caviae TaxID=648 RepID=A0AAW9F0H2_AERCA|nr:prepilin-type N-terminal cleavage/methylation domain-containing protein [Aeromonas caviae]MDX7721559.1 prepilin-type N-terminal cleavage/methylation domain-containing protein [Aeromonas caviae]GKR03555.1 MSHA biogenesis protein MshD [Aeromonas caviae]GKR11003.1 MSHA biogenesis protein MshD [Aeromonas caviae]GKR15250.1 MSHA biogenesis protein MshD [Aeromonas caviae]GKR17486.1 MSHA biogenesis protein MshD [Aeromonas caviae]
MRSPKIRRGFTLVEFVVGIVLLAIALTGVLGLLINQAPQAVDPVQQVRAAQLAQRILGEALQKSFDEHSDHNGGRFRCGETAGTPPVTHPPCTGTADYGPEGGELRPYQFNDVDDYQTSAICAKGPLSCDGDWVPANYFSAQRGQGLDESEYRLYGIRIRVSGVDLTQANLPTCTGPCSTGKRLDLTVRLPDGSSVDFTLYRGNY